MPPPPALMTPAQPLKKLETETPTPSEVITVVVENYGMYHQVANRLHMLQEWVQKQLEANP